LIVMAGPDPAICVSRLMAGSGPGHDERRVPPNESAHPALGIRQAA
jgi:hypothetical protein